MKKTNIFTLIFFTFILGALVSCKDGLTNNIDREKQLVSIQLLLEGQKLKQAGERTIGISSVDEALQGFEFTLNLVNTEDSTKNATVNGDIRTISSYLSSLRLDRGSWKINVSGAKKDVDAAINGSTSFTVGGRDSFYILNLVISGNAPGSIEFEISNSSGDMLTVSLYKREDYLLANSQDELAGLDKKVFSDADVKKQQAGDVCRCRIDGVPKGEYYMVVEIGSRSLLDVGIVYPGITSKAISNLGRYKLVLDLQCGNQGDLTDIEVGIENGIFPLPGYGGNSDRVIPIRPGYLFTGWYDTPEAAELGMTPYVPLDSKYITYEVPGKENTYLYANRTLYAGWKSSGLPDALLNKDLIYTDEYRITSGKLNDKLQKGENNYSLEGVEEQYVAVGTKVFYIHWDKLYYIDIAELDSDSSTGNESKVKEVTIPTAGNQDNQVKALYYDNDTGILYAFCDAYDEEYNDVWNIVTITIPNGAGEVPVASLFAIEGVKDGEESEIGKNCDEPVPNSDPIEFKNKETVMINKFAIINDNLFLCLYNEYKDYEQSTNDYEITKIVAFDIKNETTAEGFGKTFYGKNQSIDFADINAPSKYGYNSQYGDSYTSVEIRDMYADKNTVYVLFSDDNMDPNAGGRIEALISTGGLAALNYDMTLKGVYGKAEEKNGPNGLKINMVSYEYDTNCFMEPYKILAIFERKMIIQEDGKLYYKNKNNGYNLKKKGRVTVFDLDKNCISYTQPNDVILYESGSLIDMERVSNFSWED